MKTVIFDLDGTLADTSRDLITAANACFTALGMAAPLDPVRDRRLAYGGGRAMLRAGLQGHDLPVDEAWIDGQYPHLLRHYANCICDHTTFFPGALEAVRALSAAGYGVGICTNKPEGLAEKLMQALGARDDFGALVGADTLPTRKPDPAPFHETVARLGGTVGQTLLVGDTNTDRSTARNAAVPSILVTFGHDTAEEVAALRPEAIIDDFAHLGRAVRHLIG